MTHLVAAVLILIAACSPSQNSQRPTSSASHAPSGSLLVVAQADANRHATVSIVTGVGAAVASATFDLAPLPIIANAADLVQSPVRLAGGAVFFADAHGVVRRLDRDGRVTTVATFPLNSSQQELSFAVSPDGRQLMASILSTPPLVDPPVDPLRGRLFVPGGTWTLELFTAAAGAAPTSTLRRDLGTQYPTPTIVVGWDRAGPVATVNTNLASQDAPPSERFTGDALIHLSPDGGHLDRIGGAACRPLDELPDGTALCLVGYHLLEVRTATGDLLWQQDLGESYPQSPWLSPDGMRIASADTIFTRAGRPASAARTTAPAGSPNAFWAQGWLDAATVVAGSMGFSQNRLGPGGPLQLVDAANPSRIRPLGVSGLFEGVLQV